MPNDEEPTVRPLRVFITGARGFIGRALGADLRSNGVEVFGADRRPDADAKIRAVDVGSSAAVSGLLEQCQPKIVFHLAGVVGESDEGILEQAHVRTTEALLRAVRSACPDARVIVLGSAAEYGAGPAESAPIDEDATACPTSAYGRSKLRQSQLAQRMGQELGLDVVRVRLFNTLGPGQSTRLVVGAMVQRLHATLSEQRQRFEVFDPDSERDYLDVRDVARMAWVVATRAPREIDRPPIQIASGEGITVRKIALMLLQEAEAMGRLQPVWIRNEQRTVSVGAPTRLRQMLGHEPIRQISIPKSLRDMWAWQVHHPRGR